MTKYLYLTVLSTALLLLLSCGNSMLDENDTTVVNNDLTAEQINEISEETQTENLPEVPLESSAFIDGKANPSEFVPAGYSIYERISGDLNKDGRIDSVYIVKKIDPENIVVNDFGETVDRNRRGIMIFIKKSERWECTVQNLSCFSSENEDGGVYYPPQLTVVIKKGNLYLEYEHGRYGYWTYTFRLKEADFELIGFDSSQNYGPITNREISINYLTQRKLTRENINPDTEESGEEVFEDTWEDINVKELFISEITDFDELGEY